MMLLYCYAYTYAYVRVEKSQTKSIKFTFAARGGQARPVGTEALKRPDDHVDITACTSSELLNRSTTIRDVEVILDPKIARTALAYKDL